jgi:N,N'-diacetyllegionaminate synthase
MTHTLIIAEAGVNHNADLSLAFQLIDAAKAAGADVVKFQTAIPELVSTSYAEKAAYQKGTSGAGESQLDMIRRILFPLETFRELKRYCETSGIVFASTAFDPISLDFLEELGQPFHKVPSGEITNLPFLRRLGSFGRPVIMSTGMATMEEIRAALDVLESAGMRRDDVTVLHCNTEYPTPMVDVNLRAMQSMRNDLGVRVGYSDHTLGIEVPIAAVAMGAEVIEKHFTTDRTLPGPDQKASLEPHELAAMVDAIRNIERALGDGRKRPSPSELGNIAVARKSVVAARPIRRGEPFTEENLAVKRPGTGLSPMRWAEVLERVATRDFAADEMIEL